VISVSRIGMSVLIVVLAYDLTVITFILTVSLVVLATISDFLDGYLARRWNVTSPTGYVLDAMGDRSIHLALTLAMLVRYSYHPLIAWLLVFRDISIYAVRVLAPDWLQRSRDARWMSLLHTIGVRTWLATFLARDAVRLFCTRDYLDEPYYLGVQMLIICSSITFSYWSLYRALGWVVAREHADVERSNG
jgi:phosphatidylglycerophosphate synthase